MVIAGKVTWASGLRAGVAAGGGRTETERPTAPAVNVAARGVLVPSTVLSTSTLEIALAHAGYASRLRTASQTLCARVRQRSSGAHRMRVGALRAWRQDQPTPWSQRARPNAHLSRRIDLCVGRVRL